MAWLPPRQYAAAVDAGLLPASLSLSIANIAFEGVDIDAFDLQIRRFDILPKTRITVSLWAPSTDHDGAPPQQTSSVSLPWPAGFPDPRQAVQKVRLDYSGGCIALEAALRELDSGMGERLGRVRRRREARVARRQSSGTLLPAGHNRLSRRPPPDDVPGSTMPHTAATSGSSSSDDGDAGPRDDGSSFLHRRQITTTIDLVTAVDDAAQELEDAEAIAESQGLRPSFTLDLYGVAQAAIATQDTVRARPVAALQQHLHGDSSSSPAVPASRPQSARPGSAGTEENRAARPGSADRSDNRVAILRDHQSAPQPAIREHGVVPLDDGAQSWWSTLGTLTLSLCMAPRGEQERVVAASDIDFTAALDSWVSALDGALRGVGVSLDAIPTLGSSEDGGSAAVDEDSLEEVQAAVQRVAVKLPVSASIAFRGARQAAILTCDVTLSAGDSALQMSRKNTSDGTNLVRAGGNGSLSATRNSSRRASRVNLSDSSHGVTGEPERLMSPELLPVATQAHLRHAVQVAGDVALDAWSRFMEPVNHQLDQLAKRIRRLEDAVVEEHAARVAAREADRIALKEPATFWRPSSAGATKAVQYAR